MTRASDISDAAAEWLVRLEAETTPEIWDAFQVWLDSDLRHRAAFLRLRTAWTRVDRLKNLRPADGSVSCDLLARANLSPMTLVIQGFQPLKGRSSRVAEGPLLSGRRRWVAAAAAIAVIGTIGFLAKLELASASWDVYRTGVGGRRQVMLSDGSKIALNTNTEIAAHLSPARREIRLFKGEALFQVAHDSSRPFLVTAGDTVVRAVGTAFSVRFYADRHVDVLVAEGRVAVAPPGRAINLDNPAQLASAPSVTAAEAATITSDDISFKHLPLQDVTRRLAWTAGHLAFQGETLREAVEEFNRYNARQLTIGDPSIEQVRVGGIFLTTDPDSFVEALKLLGVRAEPEPHRPGEIATMRLMADDKP